MIFYFSGTGNSAWAARYLARLSGDEAFDITAVHELPDVGRARQIGFVFPVYAWGVPEAMADFVKKLPAAEAFAFGICTCGGDAGHTMRQLSKRYPLDAGYSLLMPNNYVVGSELTCEEEIRRRLAEARRELERIAQEIQQRQRVYRVHEGALPGLKSRLINVGFNKFARSARLFTAGDSCNGCGQCAQNCPSSAISLQDGKPVWAARCFQCMRCINSCPCQAIQYGKATSGRRRYTIWNYLPPEERM